MHKVIMEKSVALVVPRYRELAFLFQILDSTLSSSSSFTKVDPLLHVIMHEISSHGVSTAILNPCRM